MGDINVDITRLEGKSGETRTIETERTSWKTTKKDIGIYTAHLADLWQTALNKNISKLDPEDQQIIISVGLQMFPKAFPVFFTLLADANIDQTETHNSIQPERCLFMISSILMTTAFRTSKSSSEIPCCLAVSRTAASTALSWAVEAGGRARSSFSSCFSWYNRSRICDTLYLLYE